MKLTPAGFVDAARIDAARRLLADTKMPLQRIARACGFGNLNTMRRVFVRNLGVAPLDYRKSFRSAYADTGIAMPPPRRPSEPEPPKPARTAKKLPWRDRQAATARCCGPRRPGRKDLRANDQAGLTEPAWCPQRLTSFRAPAVESRSPSQPSSGRSALTAAVAVGAGA